MRADKNIPTYGVKAFQLAAQILAVITCGICKYSNLTALEEKELLNTLKALELPLQLPANVDIKEALARTARDKKFSQGNIRFVLLEHIGKATLSDQVTSDDLEEALTLLTTDLN